MDYHEKKAKALCELAHERRQRDKKYPRPMPTSTSNSAPPTALSGSLARTFYRRRLMDMLGIPVTRRWLRRQ